MCELNQEPTSTNLLGPLKDYIGNLDDKKVSGVLEFIGGEIDDGYFNDNYKKENFEKYKEDIKEDIKSGFGLIDLNIPLSNLELKIPLLDLIRESVHIFKTMDNLSVTDIFDLDYDKVVLVLIVLSRRITNNVIT